MTGHDDDDRLSRFLRHLASVIEGVPSIIRFMPADGRQHEIQAVVYSNTPMRGYVTGFTYGLSLSKHSAWVRGGRELSLTVRSDDPEWAKIPSRLAASLQGIHPFNIGQAIGYAGRLVEDSAMNSVLLAEPVIQKVGGLINLADAESSANAPDLIEVIGVYAIHASERDFVYASGHDAFWGLEWDRLDPYRSAVV